MRRLSTYERIARRFERERKAALLIKDNRAAVDVSNKLLFTGTSPTFNAKAIADAERQNVNLATAVRIIGGSIAELPFYVEEQITRSDGTIESEAIPDHPVVELLKRPNVQHDQTHVVEHMVQSLIMTGNSFHGLEKRPGVEAIAEIYPLETWKMRIIPDERTGIPKHYEYGEYLRGIKYLPEELLYIQLYSFLDAYWGRPRVEPARRQVLSDYHMEVSNETFFKDGASIDSVFSPDMELKEHQIQQIKQNIEEKHRGFEKAHGMFIPPIPGKLFTFGASMKEMQFIEGLRMNREKLFGMIGIPPFLGGVMEYANYANALVQESSYWRHTIKPLLRVIANAITRQLIQRHFEDSDAYIFTFDLSSVEALQQDDVEKARKYQILVSGGIYTPNEARAEGYELEPIEGGDALRAGGGFGLEAPIVEQSLGSGSYKLTEMQAQAIWRNFNMKAYSGEATFGQRLYKFFRAQHKRIEQRLFELTGGGKTMSLLVAHLVKDDPPLSSIGRIPAAWFDKSKEEALLLEFMSAVIERLIGKNGSRALAELNISGSFDINHPDVRQFIQTLENKFTVEVTDTTFRNIQRLLSRAYRDGQTWQQFAKALRENVSFSRSRSELAARTEMGKIVNGASVHAWKQNGVTHLQWIATRDDRTRDSHAAVDGYIVRLGQLFPNGLEFPGDPSAPAGEVCNCRCAVHGITHDDPTADLNADFEAGNNGHKHRFLGVIPEGDNDNGNANEVRWQGKARTQKVTT